MHKPIFMDIPYKPTKYIVPCVQVEIDERRDECILTIKSLRKEHEGPWECVAYEGRDEVGKKGP